MYSKAFTQYYDQLMGDYSSIVNTVERLTDTYIPPKSSLIELGCGTGNILKLLQNKYELTGIDNSPGMIEQAKRKVPTAQYYLDDITTFRHPRSYDGILCIFDTINHLTTFSKWNSLFRQVHKHLKPKGIFIFDMNTTRRLERLSLLEPYVAKIDDDTLTKVKIDKLSPHRYKINFSIFENILTDKITYIEEVVEESAFDTERVKNTLEKYFTIEKMVDPIRKRVTKNSGRIFFVCRKK